MMELSDFFNDPESPESGHEESQSQAPKPNPPSKDRSTEGRIIRRRARKACVECHKRKVRCDVLTRGQVCTNCRLDGQPCTLPAKDGRRRARTSQDTSAQEPLSYMSQIDAESTAQAFRPLTSAPKIQDESATISSSRIYPPSKLSVPGATAVSHVDVLFSYYSFLDSESLSHIPPEDFKFMENKGCFHIPSRPILDEFVREYFLHVHPMLPMLNERDFWDVYLADGRGVRNAEKVPLFLFRAMLFVSCSFVSLDTIKLMGFKDAIEARTCMYRRAKFLFDFDATTQPLGIAQGALLLTYYCSDREPLANTSWLRVAIQYANSEKVHLYAHKSHISIEERQKRKRLWWCCILRDRILPLGVRRPIQITRENFDFKHCPFTFEDLESEFDYSQVYDSETKQILARIFKSQLDLAVALTDVLSLIYPINDLDYNTLMKMPRLLEGCRAGLDDWNRESQEEFGSLGHFTNHKSVPLFYGLTQIYYLSARAALCQYESLALQASTPGKSCLRNKELGSELHSSITSISKIVGELVQLDIAQYLPVSAVAYMALPIILNSIDLQSPSTQTSTFKSDSKRTQLRLYNEAMALCQERYTGTSACIVAINRTIASAKEMFPSSPTNSISTVDSDSTSSVAPTKSSTALLRIATEKVDDWFEAFVSKPRQYLRIALTIDISLCMGRFVGQDELPRLLLLEEGDGSSMGVSRGLEPPVDRLLFEREQEQKEGGRKDLDYFDFGAGFVSEEGMSGEGNWGGDLVEEVLEEALRGYGTF